MACRRAVAPHLKNRHFGLEREQALARRVAAMVVAMMRQRHAAARAYEQGRDRGDLDDSSHDVSLSSVVRPT